MQVTQKQPHTYKINLQNHTEHSKDEIINELDGIKQKWSRIKALKNDYQHSTEAMNDHAAFKKEYETSLTQKKSKAKAYFESYMSVFEQVQDLVLNLLEPFCKKYGERVLDLQAIDSHEVVPVLPKQTIIDSRNRPKTLTGENGISAAGRKIVQWVHCLDWHDKPGHDIRDRRRTLEWLHNLVLVDGPEFCLMVEPLEWVQSVFSEITQLEKAQTENDGPNENGEFVFNGKGFRMTRGQMQSLLQLLWKSRNQSEWADNLIGPIWHESIRDISRRLDSLRSRVNGFFRENEIPYFIEIQKMERRTRVKLISEAGLN